MYLSSKNLFVIALALVLIVVGLVSTETSMGISPESLSRKLATICYYLLCFVLFCLAWW